MSVAEPPENIKRLFLKSLDIFQAFPLNFFLSLVTSHLYKSKGLKMLKKNIFL